MAPKPQSPKTPTLYQRLKIEGKGWRYQRVKTGRGIKTGDLTGPFYLHVVVGTKPNGKPDQQWHPLVGDTFKEADEDATTIQARRDAKASGVKVEGEDFNRIPIKTAVENFLSETAKSKGKATVAAYTLHLNQFLSSNGKIRFIDEVNGNTLKNFRDFLAGQKFSEKTQHNRVVTVLTLLKKHGVKHDFSLADDLPSVDEEPAIPYESEELKKLFEAMDPEESIRYKFFLGTACRDKEVTFAAWSDIDFTKGLYHVRPKKDAGFTIKNHQTRTVKMPAELVDLLKARKKKAPHPRWIFVNEDGRPDNHFLRKLKRIAHRAGLNCGHCKTTVTKGKYETKRAMEVTCATDPVCKNFYLHRFRKTCATRWEQYGIPVRTIQYMLGHKSLDTTQKYLGVGDLAGMSTKFDSAFGD
jgi:integrase/recombinase XerD